MASSSSDFDRGENIGLLVVTAEEKDVHTVREIDPNDPTNISFLLAFEWTQAALQSFCVNEAALLNMLSMLVTLDTSHLEMSPLNDDTDQNMPAMSVTLDTSHLEMSPLKCEKVNK